MIATSTGFWKAFFDPNNVNHKKAKEDIEIYDDEKIIIDSFTLSEVVSWLLEQKKHEIMNWFLDYAKNTANVRTFYIGKQELEFIINTSINEKINFSDACLSYLHKYLNCDITNGY